MPETLFSDAVALMTYDHHSATFELAEFQTLVNELTTLANSVDR